MVSKDTKARLSSEYPWLFADDRAHVPKTTKKIFGFAKKPVPGDPEASEDSAAESSSDDAQLELSAEIVD
eukprot:13043160-Alexandrium_andersonii.AAC.1